MPDQKKVLRVRPYSAGGPTAVYDPELADYVVPDPAKPYDEDDPIVKLAPWMFVSDDDLDTTTQQAPTSVAIEPEDQAAGRGRRSRRG